MLNTGVGAAIALGIGISLASAGVSLAQSIPEKGSGASAPSSIDCTKVSVEYADDPSLTREEKLQLMDQALLRSLSKFDACQNSQAGSAAGGSAGSDAASNAAGGSGSIPAADMSGTEKAAGSAGAAANEGTDAGSSDQLEAAKASGPRAPQQTLDNGKTPEDIPPADNDSVLEAQIRQAAINETDPETQKKLWNEYRKYKGLPRVE